VSNYLRVSSLASLVIANTDLLTRSMRVQLRMSTLLVQLVDVSSGAARRTSDLIRFLLVCR
jgi:hypothetical protein